METLTRKFRFQHSVGGGKGGDYEPQLASFPWHILTVSLNFLSFACHNMSSGNLNFKSSGPDNLFQKVLI